MKEKRPENLRGMGKRKENKLSFFIPDQMFDIYFYFQRFICKYLDGRISNVETGMI